MKNISHNLLQDSDCNKDELTKLNRFSFFEKNYFAYIKNYPESKLIFIDFVDLKGINTNFGHKGGNECFISFGKILSELFSNSLITRKHGDEFLILTSLNYQEIEKRFNSSIDKIKDHYENNLIPIMYKFNAGIVPATSDLDLTTEKANIIMYNAKIKNLVSLRYDEAIYESALQDKLFIKNIKQKIKNDNFSLSYRNIFQINSDKTNIIDLYTRLNDESIFSENNYELINNSNLFIKIDQNNVNKICSNTNLLNEKLLIVNIHYTTLLNNYYDYIQNIITVNSKNDIKNNKIIISIIIDDLKQDFDVLIKKIETLTEIGFEICLNSLNFSINNPTLSLWPFLNIRYVKIHKNCWKDSMDNFKLKALLNFNLKALTKNNTIPIFMKVETIEELNFIKTISNNALIIGNVFENKEFPYI